jgi:tetratricopeptide (TPR) repeat protein
MRSRFASEAAWPFKLRISQLASCRDFLAPEGRTPRLLRVCGASGTGKSFLVRELIVQAAAGQPDGVALYVDIPPDELEGSALFEKLDALLSERRSASRDAPSSVDRKTARAWVSAKSGRSAKRLTYAYGAARDLVGQIPVAGPFIKALLPLSAPMRLAAGESASPIRFLMRRSRSRHVLLAIDNIQFLPFAVGQALAAELEEAGPYLRLVLVERIRGMSRVDWVPDIPGADMMDVELANASLHEVTELVREVMPEAEDYEDVASTIFRRSEGNLKSVWFQLRLISSRREDQEESPASYEDVILSLVPSDQAVLRFVVFTIGGLTIAHLASLLQATDLHLRPDVVSNSIADLAALGLLVVNGEGANRVRVEHELVAHVVSDITPEEEKLELREQAVNALRTVLEAGVPSDEEAVLYDRLLGIVSEVELRQTPSLLAHVVRFIQTQSEFEQHAYLSSVCRDTVCWDVLDSLPETTLRSLLDAIQKVALFDFGLIATARLRHLGEMHESLASLYEAKYLVQLFRYEEATAALERVPESKEKRTVAFNIVLNLVEDDRAAEVAMGVFREVSHHLGSEHDYLVLRNSLHLFAPDVARTLVETALEGFRALGLRFGVATTLNNLGVVELAAGRIGVARDRFETARRELVALNSPEVYEALVDLSAIALLDGDVPTAARLLSEAREAAPRSLLQDRAMLDLNAIALEICGDGRLRSDVVTRMATVADAARRTRDLRFVQVAEWFAGCLELALSGTGGPPAALRQKVEKMRASERVAIEVFLPTDLDGVALDVPYVLSPHWRY